MIEMRAIANGIYTVLVVMLAMTAPLRLTFAQGIVEQRPESPEGGIGRPNVVIWLMDDVGFGQLGAFGGPVATPNLDELARSGLRMNNFHTTAVCSSSRASLLTGRNHHAVGFGNHAGFRTADAGYRAEIPPSAASIARVLKDNGYATWAVGKWDQLPIPHISENGPFDNWPSGQGFERFYGFLYADMDHFSPVLWRDHTPIEPSRGRSDYHLTTDLADQAIAMISERNANDPTKPFLLYWASGAGHAPHHAPAGYIARYKGRFDGGWEHEREQTLKRQKSMKLIPQDTELPEWPTNIPRWNSLDDDARKIASRSMEVFAAQLTHADHEFGRIVAELKRSGELDNTIIIVTADNGASAAGGMDGTFNEWRFSNGLQTSTRENLAHLDDWGGPSTYPEYPAGWAVAGNAPFRYYKTQVHYGGIRAPMIFFWPRGIEGNGGVRTQFHHLNDVMSTILDLAGIEAPAIVGGVAQQRFDGASMRSTLERTDAPTNHPVQYFELFGNRAIVADGWKAVVVHRKEPWKYNENRIPYERDQWELYDLAHDFNELHDLAAARPGKLFELQQLFEQEGRRNDVFPLTPDFATYQLREMKAKLAANGGRFVYRPSEFRRHVQGAGAPPVGTFGSFELVVDLSVSPEAVPEGVIVADGGRAAGYALYVSRGVPIFAYNFVGTSTSRIRADQALAPGRQELRVSVVKDGRGGADVTISAFGQRIGAGRIEQLVPRMFQGSDAFNLGFDEGSRVSDEYGDDDRFTGELHEVMFDFSAALMASGAD